MPLDISEVRIRMRVGDANSSKKEDADAEAEGDGEEGTSCGGPDRAQLVDDCVRRVLRILKTREER